MGRSKDIEQHKIRRRRISKRDTIYGWIISSTRAKCIGMTDWLSNSVPIYLSISSMRMKLDELNKRGHMDRLPRTEDDPTTTGRAVQLNYSLVIISITETERSHSGCGADHLSFRFFTLLSPRHDDSCCCWWWCVRHQGVRRRQFHSPQMTMNGHDWTIVWLEHSFIHFQQLPISRATKPPLMLVV